MGAPLGVDTALMAAVGMGGTLRAWVQPESEDRVTATLATVKLPMELGIDSNAVSADGRTALDAAKASGFAAVAAFLEQRGAR